MIGCRLRAYFEVKYKLAQFRQDFQQALAEIYEKSGGSVPEGVMPKDIYSPFRELIKQLLPGIRFDTVTIEDEIFKVYFSNRMGIRVEFDQLSSGEKDIIAMLFPFIEKEVENELAKAKGEELPHEDLVVMIDGPEAYLHPTLERNLLDYIRNSVIEGEIKGEKLQFFIATHSTTIINEARPEELYIMVFPDQSPDGNQVVKISTEEEKLHLIRDVLGDVGLASLATGKPILLLEGKNDVDTLKLLKPNVEEKFTLLPLGGIGKISAFTEAFEKVIPELSKRGFKIFAILDGDSQLASVKSDLCFTWSKVCLENFLLQDSEAIYEALKVMVGKKKLEDEGITSTKKIDSLIDEIIRDPETAREEVKRRLGEQTKFYVGHDWENVKELEERISDIVSKKLDRIGKRYELLNQEIKEKVVDREKALAELSGKIIIGRLASRFNLERDMLARTIADKLRSLGRPPKEITDIIAQIENRC